MNQYSSSTLDATPIGLIKPFTEQLQLIVETMQKQMAEEVKILEGTEIPDYSVFRNQLDEETKNEPSEREALLKEWTNSLPDGFLKTDLTQDLTQESDILSTFAELFNQNCLSVSSNEKLTPLSMNLCKETLDVSGCETDVMNVCYDCTVPMISELTDGTLNEVK